MTVSEACAAYLRELEARNIRKTTRKCYRSMFRQLQTFAEAEKIESLEVFDRDALRRWRSQWTWAHSTQGRVLAQLNAFFRFAQGEGWIAASPARGIRRPNSDAKPTIPLSRDEVRALLVATMRKPREQAMLLLLRYSGLAIRDAAALSRDALHPNGDLVLRRAKSGELVTVALPWEVAASLEAVAIPGRSHFFWTGRSEPETASKYWRNRLKEVAAAAGVEGFHPHRLRDNSEFRIIPS